jgi:hypothetical protein
MTNLDALVTSLRSEADQTTVELQVHEHLDEIVRISQSVLKTEWIRVKLGS